MSSTIVHLGLDNGSFIASTMNRRYRAPAKLKFSAKTAMESPSLKGALCDLGKPLQFLIERSSNRAQPPSYWRVGSAIGRNARKVIVALPPSRIAAGFLDSVVEESTSCNQVVGSRGRREPSDRDAVQRFHKLMQLHAVRSTVNACFRSEAVGFFGRHFVYGIEGFAYERCGHPYKPCAFLALLSLGTFAFQLMLKENHAESADDGQGRCDSLRERQVIPMVPRHA
jgi:hypothetical protein